MIATNYINRVFRNGKNEIVNMNMKTLVEPAEFIKILDVSENQYGSAGRYDFSFIRFGEPEPTVLTLTLEDFDKFLTPTIKISQ